MLLIMMTFLGLCWIIKFRAFKQEEKAYLPSNTAIIIPMHQHLHNKESFPVPVTIEDKIISFRLKRPKISMQQAK